ncbi:MAG: DUF2069 domain-containing protein [Gammaproteobacteria bacterium]|nr:DUF2069 domain-containing protein [Gammaproteobacteria bacterium]MCB1926033.1 DUF2069 domain-containing protein [Gammaproteobacteria bacterium]
MKTGLARGLSLAAYLGLFAWVMLWIIVLGDVAREHVSMWLLFFAGPLLLPLRGVLRGNDKPLIWGALVALLYTVHGGMVAWSDDAQRWLGIVEMALSLVYVISASLFIRWRAEAAHV